MWFKDESVVFDLWKEVASDIQQKTTSWKQNTLLIRPPLCSSLPHWFPLSYEVKGVILVIARRQDLLSWLRHTGLLMSSVIAKLIRWPLFLKQYKVEKQFGSKNHQTHTHTHVYTCIQINCSHVTRVRLAMITEVECRKAVHGKGKLASGTD